MRNARTVSGVRPSGQIVRHGEGARLITLTRAALERIGKSVFDEIRAVRRFLQRVDNEANLSAGFREYDRRSS